ncbi:MAG: DUF948 domain-containing protein [Actinobacteria bacterium]|jgi:uncharacterized protein YoxC|nr:DUF948 domain-containing protein [Actinomycetota bacterium]
MGPGGIATIIAASALAVIALAIAYAIVRLGRLVDEASATLKSVSSEVNPLLEEVTTTVQLVNGPLHSLNKITKSAEELTTKVTASTESFLDNNKMAMKVAGALIGASKLKKSAGKSKRRKVEDEEFE